MTRRLEKGLCLLCGDPLIAIEKALCSSCLKVYHEKARAIFAGIKQDKVPGSLRNPSKIFKVGSLKK